MEHGVDAFEDKGFDVCVLVGREFLQLPHGLGFQIDRLRLFPLPIWWRRVDIGPRYFWLLHRRACGCGFVVLVRRRFLWADDERFEAGLVRHYAASLIAGDIPSSVQTQANRSLASCAALPSVS